ncbi:MAG: WD40/YVTN/BNR-like repeat-containing protein [Flavobacteriales bacterium]
MLKGQIDSSALEGIEPRSIGPAGMSGRVTSIDARPEDPDRIWIGTASGGVFRSKNGGIDWTPLFDQEAHLSIGAITLDPQNPDVIWVGTGEGNPRNSVATGGGIFKSLDGGESWQCMGLKATQNIHRILVHPRNPDIVMVAVIGSPWKGHRERGVYRTEDGGKSWEKVLYKGPHTGCADLVMDPSNPDKLFAAMWEHQRWPWFFRSGGPNSGLYVTHNGGEDWKEIDEEKGLPGGDLGRIGLAIAPSDPERVYALVEAEKNALYRSDDGGSSFQKINSDDIGGRPFYYADLVVDPENKNRLYNLYSRVSKSENGGKDFKVLLPYSKVHPDHHAFWINPKDPSFLLDGNDGGLAISRDFGENWRFVENLPLAQYYHINVDQQKPYNIYGGMQDNGTWRGPAYVWRAGGIRNSYWEELYFGDGFDVVPDQSNERYGYAMSQGGSLARYDIRTGHTERIKPAGPDSVELRFNWNAPIAQDPNDTGTIYYGSQFLHKSTNRGSSWSIISPDLTTDAPSKQKQEKSGGLTLDVTKAENHTTIRSIAISPLREDLIWVGTDDGNLQLSKNGGKDWHELSERLPDAPDSAYIAQVKASKHDPSTAFVVMNDYRRGDRNAYAYKTTDMGASWTRITDGKKVDVPVRCLVQDPEEASLLFLGADNGLYFSLNGGKDWNKWRSGYPNVQTRDLVIHPREHDLVIGTFGRSAYVLDDIRPIRTLARKGTDILNDTLRLYKPPPAYNVHYKRAAGTRFAADAVFQGENRPYGARFTYSLPSLDTNEKGKAIKKGMVHILETNGDTVRSFKTKLDSGMNRFQWRLREDGVRYPNRKKPDKPRYPSGQKVLPGSYKAILCYQDASDSVRVKVHPDPRKDFSMEKAKVRHSLYEEHLEGVRKATKAADRLRKAKKTVQKIKGFGDRIEKDSLRKRFMGKSDSLLKGIDTLLGSFKRKDREGIYRDPELLIAHLRRDAYYLRSTEGKPGKTQKKVHQRAMDKLRRVLRDVNSFFQGSWKEYEKLVRDSGLSFFRKEQGPIEVPERTDDQ